ncbi:hypothetical protein AQJ23_36015 [Streptomyces antibioticus]|nr:hypothetical protein [Streptomyces antibioticus]KUN19856.1 hypothetical protein AQJ23_36015 [Streptomyces antibioticus]
MALIALVAIGTAVSLTVTLTSDHDHGSVTATGTSTSDRPTASPTDPSTPSADAPETTFDPDPSAATGNLPDGYVAYDDPEGFRIAVPGDWLRTATASQYGIDVVNYRSPEGDRRLQVFQVEEPTAYQSFQVFLSDAYPRPDGFVERSLTNADDAGTAVLLEYTADSFGGEPDIGPWHAYDLRFLARDGEVYALASYGTISGNGDEWDILDTASTWFCPPGLLCEEPTV